MKYLYRYKWPLLFLSITTIIIYNELYLYYNHNWNNLHCNGSCTKILLVADPQLIGLRNEIIHFITPVSIWDSDKFLEKTYSIVFNYAKPDVVIFLGDLLDEGSSATNDEYQYYLERFNRIFKIRPSDRIKYIFIPGDNDIGGEGRDRLTDEKLDRFEYNFKQPDTISLNYLTFYKVNRFTETVPKLKLGAKLEDETDLRVVISHKPLLFIPSKFVDTVIKTLHPQLIFSAHEHKSMLISMESNVSEKRQIIPINQDSGVQEHALSNDNIYEFLVPTCSYRMGTMKIGFGFAVIDNENVVQYTVYWSPSRFMQLLNYLIVLIFFMIVGLVTCCRRKCCRSRHIYLHTPLNNNKLL